MELITRNRCFGGDQDVYTHKSDVCGVDMTFAVYLPPQSRMHPVPLLWYLSGLTCTHDNAMTKGGFQKYAADHGLALVFPDTSPRGDGVADDEAYDLGVGAGFYVNATQDPWLPHFQMYDYVVKELRNLVMDQLPVTDRQGITGHSMGGHGALIMALRNPSLFVSLSAFAPIVNPSRSDWGRKQFSAYLGEDEAAWSDYDATTLMSEVGWHGDILIDQGANDQFVDLLRPQAFAEAVNHRRQPCVMRTHAGHDHSYFFVSSFAGDHVAWHAERLLTD
ncbi:S-formylglutathione hydrolase [Loktanella agnita]|uniref:S-formylglutathione hydrolase n=1 Tax=Loktanella agnita TaxID=287097 RepID=UPI0039869B4D